MNAGRLQYTRHAAVSAVCHLSFDRGQGDQHFDVYSFVPCYYGLSHEPNAIINCVCGVLFSDLGLS